MTEVNSESSILLSERVMNQSSTYERLKKITIA